MMETLDLRKDAAIYYTVISAVQSAAQSRRLIESKAKLRPEPQHTTGSVIQFTEDGIKSTEDGIKSTAGTIPINGDTAKIPYSVELKKTGIATTKLPDEDASAAALLEQVNISIHSHHLTSSHTFFQPTEDANNIPPHTT